MRLSLSGRIAANSLVQMAGKAVGTLISLIAFAAIARALGPSSFGDYAAAMAFLGIPLFFGDIGLNWNVLRELSKHPDQSRRLLGSSIVARCIISAAALAVALGVARLLPFNAQVEYAVAVGALGAFLNMVDSSLWPAFQAELRMHWAALTSVVSLLLTLGLVLAIIAAGYGFHAIIWAYVFGNAVNLALDAAIAKRVLGITLNFDVRHGVALLRGTAVLGLAMTCGTAYWYVDRVLLALLRPPREVGLYGAAFKYVELSWFAVSAISVSVFPLLVRAIAAGGRERIGYLLQWTADIMVLTAAPFCAFGLAFADVVVTKVAGEEFAPAAPVLQVFSLAIVVIFLAAPFERALIAGHREGLLGALNGAALAVNVAVSVIVIPPFGYMGLAIASLAVNSVWVVAAGLVIRRLYGFTPRPAFAGAVVIAGGAMVAILKLAPISYIPASALAIVVYTVLVVALSRRGRDIARRLAVDLRPQRRPPSVELAGAGRWDERDASRRERMVERQSVHPATSSEWQTAYERSPDATFFQGPLWSETWAEYSGGRFRPAPLTVEFRDGAAAVLGVTVERTPLRQERWHLSPAGTYGGWVSAEPLSAGHAGALTRLLLERRQLVWRSGPDGPMGDGSTAAVTEDGCTHMIDLREGAEAARAAWKGSARRSAGAARRRGVTVRQGSGGRDWKDYCRLYQATVRGWDRASMVYQPLMFDVLASHGSDEIRLALAIHDGRPVAGGIIFVHGSRAVYWSGASAKEVHGATNLLLWELLAELAGEGVQLFDLNPSGGHAGVAAFKESLGARAYRAPIVSRKPPAVRMLGGVRQFTRQVRNDGRRALHR